ncbi:MAG: glycogen debranching protein GlgX [Acidimicrobiia bacterium]|nr:glycogen debranching protein GlgX [Acidimicrobiia bacterium]
MVPAARVPTPPPDRAGQAPTRLPRRGAPVSYGQGRDAGPSRVLAPGPHWDGVSTAFTVFSSVAERVDLCLLRARASAHGHADADEQRIPLQRHGHLWHAEVEGTGPGQRYGFRVTGPYPCDPAKLLVDPYARAIDGELRWSDALLRPGEDSVSLVPHAVVVNPYFEWGDVPPPRVPWTETVIYEAHVKGLTMTHPEVPPADRGTYRGVAHPAVIEHLQRLGVTTVELLPVHHFVTEAHLDALGLRNYWGYNTLGFFAPYGGYAAPGTGPGGQLAEFKAMVRDLHRAGLEVVLDVVYNHTAEAGAGGPTLSLRGLDAAAYYRFEDGDPDRPVNWSGTGNTLNVDHPAALRLVLDSLRYWVSELHVDGFRFDLAPVLGRDHGRFDRGAAFFDAVYQDPVLAGAKLIAEPWDLGPDGYHVGGFPLGWSEWNGRYRDSVRDVWRGRHGTLPTLAASLAGSADRFHHSGRSTTASVNFVTAHDGFTLADLVSYDHKHNEANGEANRDGTDDNRSWNCGFEGPTAGPGVRALRARQQRNQLTTLFLAQGVPMLLAGDELGNTQHGNNNAYCQDNELAWLDWEHVDAPLRRFVSRLAAFRREHGVLRRANWATGRPRPGTGVVDMAWFAPSGAAMSEADWRDGGRRALAVLLDGRADATAPDADGAAAGERASVLVLLNAGDTRQLFCVPQASSPERWRKVIDTAEHSERVRRYRSGDRLRLEAFSIAVLVGG